MFIPKQPAAHATPTELRERAKTHMAKWRELLQDDPRAAREELEMATTLADLASEVEESAARYNNKEARRLEAVQGE